MTSQLLSRLSDTCVLDLSGKFSYPSLQTLFRRFYWHHSILKNRVSWAHLIYRMSVFIQNREKKLYKRLNTAQNSGFCSDFLSLFFLGSTHTNMSLHRLHSVVSRNPVSDANCKYLLPHNLALYFSYNEIMFFRVTFLA